MPGVELGRQPGMAGLPVQKVAGPVEAARRRLAAEAGVAVFKVAFDRWINEGRRDQLPQFLQESLDELKAVSRG